MATAAVGDDSLNHVFSLSEALLGTLLLFARDRASDSLELRTKLLLAILGISAQCRT